MKDRLPPHSVEAERGLLGCILLDPVAGLSKCREQIPAGEPFFYITPHQIIWQAVEKLAQTEQSVDLSRIVVELEGDGKLDTVGGFPFLSSLMDSVPSAANLSYYLSTVREKWLLRKVISGCTSIIQAAHEQPSEQEIRDIAESTIFGIVRGDTSSDRGTCDGARLADLATRSAEERYVASQDTNRRLLTGFPSLDGLVSMRPGHLIIVAARPSVGKTSFALNVCLNIARQEIPVGFVSLEMSAEEVGEQLACTLGQVDSMLLDRQMTDADFDRYGAACWTIQKLPLYLEDGAGWNIWTVKQRVRALKQRHNVAIAAVDYLQLVGGDRRYDNREQEVASVALGLKHLAKELRIPILCLCQLNRDIEKGTYRAPRKSDLRESGAIEQHADQIWFLHQRDAEPQDPLRPAISLIVDKQRRGRTGTAHLTFDKTFTRFNDSKTLNTKE